MILLWFLLGFVLIVAIARYNENDKLFWTLIFAYMFGIVGGKLYADFDKSDESKIDLAQVQPMQSAKDTLNLSIDSLANVDPMHPQNANNSIHTSAGKATPVQNKINLTSSSHVIKPLLQPPQNKILCNRSILILHERNKRSGS